MNTISIEEFYGNDLLSKLFESKPAECCKDGFQHRLLKNEFVIGNLQCLCVEDVVVSYQEWQLIQPFQLSIAHREQLIKLQFEIEGDSKFRSDDSKKIDIPEGHYQFIYIPNAKGKLEYSKSRKVLDLHISLEHLLQFLTSQGLSDKEIREHLLIKHYSFFRSAMKITPQQHALIRELLNHQYQEGFAKEFIRIKALELIYSAFKDNAKTASETKWRVEDRTILLEIKNYLDCHFQQELHLKTIARQFGINEFKLKNAFKDLFQDTVINYVRKQRVKHAHHLLMHSNMEIKEIAFISGFKYAHHFSQVYLQHYERLPSETRQAINR